MKINKMKSYSIKFINNKGYIYEQKICCLTDYNLTQVIRSAWKTLYEGKKIAGTALIDSIKEVDYI